MEWTPFIAPAITVTGTIAGVLIANWFAMKKLRKDLLAGIDKDRYTRILDACQGCWKLLAYTTDTQNPLSVLRRVEDKSTQKKTWYFNISNGKAYIEALASFFYGEGKGLFLPQEIRPYLFEYRSIVFGLLLSASEEKGEEVVIKNEKLPERLNELHQKMVILLRQSAGLEKPELPAS